ncbi:MAG TPA: tetratricopeptide repeat protein [Thermoanaerobaculia bacterium]|nr:tetratricopeptide repeat protein [Thermoanaerobaculia bacterium]
MTRGPASDLSAAIALVEGGDAAAAIRILEPIARANPRNARAFYWLGRAFLAEGRPADASQWLERAAALEPNRAEDHLWLARAYAGEAAHSINAVRLFVLGWSIGDELETAVRLDPASLDARLDLVRYFVLAPRIVGGGVAKAKQEAAEIAHRNPPLGAYALGYIAYRGKEYDAARKHFGDAINGARAALANGSDPRAQETLILTLTWFGYLSQETHDYDAAFDAFGAVIAADPVHTEALYEIGRTAVFAGRELDRGQDALRKYLASKPRPGMPSLASAHLQLGLLLEKRGDREAAKREIAAALRLDPEVEGGKAQ